MKPLTRPIRLLDDERGLELYPILRFLLQELGPGYLAWDSIALRLELEERWGQPGPLTWQRVQAGRVLLGNDSCWIHMEPFENVGLSMVGEIPVFSHMQPMEAESIAVVLHTMSLVSERPLSDEVRGYALSCCLEDATWFFEPGTPLEILTEDLREYDRSHRLRRPHDSVREILSRRDTPIADPQSSSEVQLNNVLSVRRVLTEYKGRIKSQIEELIR